ncbi:MAG: YezD family protein [Janthinobacterium lividum]
MSTQEKTLSEPAKTKQVFPPQETLPMTAVQQAISSVQFGVVQIIIQNGRIVQIDKTEKIRLV